MVITKDELADLPIEVFKGQIVVVDELSKVDAACHILGMADIIGFDTETKPAFKKGVSNKVALLQLSTDDTCFLFRINKIGVPEKVMEILNAKDIRVIGLSLKDDFAALRKVGPFKPNNFIEIQALAKQYGIDDMSLQKIHGILFHKRITKGQRLSNWEAEELTEAQQMYAAIDAWSCLKIYRELLTRKPLSL